MLDLAGHEPVDLQELFALEISEENVGGRGQAFRELPYGCQERGSDAATPLGRIGRNCAQVDGVGCDLPVGEPDDLVPGGGHHHSTPQQSPRQGRRREFTQNQPADRFGAKQALVRRPVRGLGDASDSQQVLPRTLADDHAGKLLLVTAARRLGTPYTRLVDPLLITAAGLGVLVLLTSLLWLTARHGRRKARRASAELSTDLSAARVSVDSLRIGEREAAWATTATAQRLDRTMVALGKADHEVDRLGADLDELRTRLGTADRELEGLRANNDEASTRIAVLEGDLERSRRVATDAEDDLRSLEDLERRLEAAVTERDELSATAQQVTRLQSELAALDQVQQDLAAARSEVEMLSSRTASPSADVEREETHIANLQAELARLRSQLDESQHDADRLIASEAARRDLEDQLAGLTAARSAERKASGDRIASLERLHGRIEERDRRITELEAEVESMSAVDPAAPPSTYAEWDHTMRAGITSSVAKATSRLKGQVAHLRTVIAEKERLLQERGQGAPVRKGPIPVTAIKGIGPVIAEILAGRGVTSIEDIAALTDDDIERLGEAMPVYPGRIRGDNWVGQAQALLG